MTWLRWKCSTCAWCSERPWTLWATRVSWTAMRLTWWSITPTVLRSKRPCSTVTLCVSVSILTVVEVRTTSAAPCASVETTWASVLPEPVTTRLSVPPEAWT